MYSARHKHVYRKKSPVEVMESGNTEKKQSTVMQNVVTLAAHVSLHKINREKVPWAWLLVVFSKDFLVKKADLCRKEDKYLSHYACLLCHFIC